MILRLHHALPFLGLLLLASSLGGCGTLNEKASAAFGDYVPQWAGGLPADAPPRPGTAKYDEWMKERERLRQMPADQRPPDQQAPATSKPFSWGSSSASKPASGAAATQGGTPSSVLDPVH